MVCLFDPFSEIFSDWLRSDRVPPLFIYFNASIKATEVVVSPPPELLNTVRLLLEATLYLTWELELICIQFFTVKIVLLSVLLLIMGIVIEYFLSRFNNDQSIRFFIYLATLLAILTYARCFHCLENYLVKGVLLDRDLPVVPNSIIFSLSVILRVYFQLLLLLFIIILTVSILFH